MTGPDAPTGLDQYADGTRVQTEDGTRGWVRTCPCGKRFVATSANRTYHDDPCKARMWRARGPRTVRMAAVERAVRALAAVAEPSDWDDIQELIRTVRKEAGQ